MGMISAGLAGLALLSDASRAVFGPVLMAFLALQALWFGLSHEIARRRFQRTETWQRSLTLMVQRDTWAKLEI